MNVDRAGKKERQGVILHQVFMQIELTILRQWQGFGIQVDGDEVTFSRSLGRIIKRTCRQTCSMMAVVLVNIMSDLVLANTVVLTMLLAASSNRSRSRSNKQKKQ